MSGERSVPRGPVGREPTPGFEEIDLDLSSVPSVEEGLKAATEPRNTFKDVAKEVLGEPDQLLFREHLPFFSFINRASSLHAGIASAVREENPHAAFTLLRAYLELVVLVYYLDGHPDYLAALERPVAELPKNTRIRFSEQFDFAASELAGVRHVYSVLSELAHFGSTALWLPFSVDGDDERTLTFSTGPHWKQPNDARVALAMLQESDETMVAVLRRYACHHVAPKVMTHAAWQRAARAVAESFGSVIPSAAGEFAVVPPEAMADAQAAGLVSWCEEHAAFEITAASTAEQLEEWAMRRGSRETKRGAFT